LYGVRQRELISHLWHFSPDTIAGALLAIADVHVYKLTYRWFGRVAAHWALLCSLLSWFNFFCGVRTLSSSMEAVLTPVALVYWPEQLSPMRPFGTWRAVCGTLLVGLVCLIRPTAGERHALHTAVYMPALCLRHVPEVSCCLPSGTPDLTLGAMDGAAITWFFMVVQLLYKANSRQALRLIAIGIGCASACMAWSLLVDRWFYGMWIVVQYEFLQFNLLQVRWV